MTDENRSPGGESTMTLALIEEQADASIRRQWVGDRWYFAIVDVLGVLTDSAAPLQYWRDTKARMRRLEGWRQTQENLLPLRLRAADGKMRETDAADSETILRIIQSVPSPKAEPVKQWLARVGAERLDSAARSIDAAQASADVATVAKPATDAPALAWAKYHEQLAALYYRQADYEARLTVIDAQLAEHDTQLGEVHSRLESLEAGQRLLPELLLTSARRTKAVVDWRHGSTTEGRLARGAAQARLGLETAGLATKGHRRSVGRQCRGGEPVA